MGLLKLIGNRISTEWKEKFNQNIDYLNDLEKKLSDQDKSTNSRIDNLVLHSGGESPNEVVDARVNNKGEVFDTLQARLKAHEDQSDEEISQLSNDASNQKEELDQLNSSVQQIIGRYNEPIDIYVSKNGSDQTGDGTEEKPYATIQTAVNTIPLITASPITIWIDDGAYLEDVVINGLSYRSLMIKPINDISSINPLTSDLPVRVRSLATTTCVGYTQISGIQIVDTVNAPIDPSGNRYGIMNEQSDYMAINKCKFSENTKSLGYNAIYVGGVSKLNMYGNTTFINQDVALRVRLMSEALAGLNGSGNNIGIKCEDATVRGTASAAFATTPTSISGNGLIISKGQVLS
ncbi:hypothetical protein F6X86_08960 [Enterococcus durans]|uniref:hypothetical protein n=1 Tax=Enterococcus durans TaxID=53345 RepID=UPI0012442980|nr:hypothetical protein [Enterococcus durans]KAA9178319.1 hypothetical protein F6X86_08960 [Enterococcus durans]KAA9184635.1 hypothetical protein F6X85_09475 [Enterococcus durans]KAA9185648.1 hypothetical protein F6X90_09255 [Enterococcus durans]KAA9189934.1 hypothetical protein F6Y12_09130 [Enterococcus durans]KAA9215665.1 hypothetical protein F6X97_07735 [Enterococcus durans]